MKSQGETGQYGKACKMFNGDYTLLWHNSSFGRREYKKAYKMIIS